MGSVSVSPPPSTEEYLVHYPQNWPSIDRLHQTAFVERSSIDGGTWAAGQTHQESLTPRTIYHNFSGADDVQDTFTFRTLATATYKWTSDYEAGNPVWYEGNEIDPGREILLTNGISISFTSPYSYDYVLGDYWRFFCDYKYPPENVYNWNQRETWRTTDGGTEWLVMDLGSGNSRPLDILGLFNTNLRPESSVKFQAGDGSSWDYPPMDITINMENDGTVIQALANTTSYRYYRLYMQDSLLAFIEVGGMIATTSVSMEMTSEQPDMVVSVDGTYDNQTAYGQRGVRWMFDRESYTLGWGNLKGADFAKMVDLRRVVKGGRKPFIFSASGLTSLVRWSGQFSRQRRAAKAGGNLLYQAIQVVFDEEVP
ncbi:MAG: hypothetical protein GY847_01445 [Proteobacteria bacterium]|nr:hypothetical protein [Pseudomonadota bacterium]